jgi:hypothetical protein
MGQTLRSLNPRGLDRFRDYLDDLRAGQKAPLPEALLHDDGLSSELDEQLIIAPQAAGTQLDLSRYLVSALAPLDQSRADRDDGLWAWLSVYYFDLVCPVRADGTRRPGLDYRHVPHFTYRDRYRHLIYGPYLVFRQLGIRSILLLCSPPSVQGAIYQDFVSRQDLIVNRGAMEAAMLLYFDSSTMRPRKGVASSVDAPGSVRRFLRVLQQLDLTYDIHGLDGKKILELLPPEFDRWRPQRKEG